jgi:hypothetical protein
MNDTTKTVTFPEGGNYVFDLSTHNGGTNIFISEVSRNRIDAEVETKIDLINANVTAANAVITTLLGNAASQAVDLTTLTSNAASQASNLITLTSNAASQASNLITLTSNAASQAVDLTTLTANAATQSESLTELINNAASQSSALTTIDANIGVLYLGNVSINANLGAFQTYANTDLVTVNANIGTINSGNLNVTGVANIAPISEKFISNTGPGAAANVTIDFSQTAIVYVSGASGNITANVQNFNIPSGTISCVTVWMSQGPTPYVANLIQINSSVKTIKWQGATTPPPGNANKQDVISFTILNNGGTYTVLGQLATFG